MPQYDDTMRGVLFPQKQESEQHPSSTGAIHTTCEECGHDTEHRLAGWVNTSREGRKYQTLQVSAMQPPQKQQAQASEEFDDAIPF